MSGSTTELNLATAVDSDDNADYLTLSLANSLRTVDALFNNVTGHNHGGAHQGGAIAPAAIPGGSITNAMLGADVARDSLLTNGGFEVWQRGNGPFSASGAYCADRWSLAPGSGSSFSNVLKVNSPAPGGGQYSLNGTYTHSAASYILQQIKTSEGGLGGGPGAGAGVVLSLSMYVTTATANAVRIGLQTDGTGGTITYSAFHTGAGGFARLTVANIAVPTDATFVSVLIALSASCTFYVDNAMLVVGSQAANYVPMHPADDLARCLRYYEIIGDASQVPIISGYNTAGLAQYTTFPYKVQKAITPTVTKNGTWGVSNCGQPSVTNFSVQGVTAQVTVTATGGVITNPSGPGQNFSNESNP
jgi:hypothetical protein